MKSNQLLTGLRWVALVIMGLFVAFLLFMGIGEMVGGDSSGIAHLLPAVLGAGLFILAWKRPWIGGSILFLLGLLNTIRFGRQTYPGEFIPAGVLILGLPLILCGLIFLGTAWSNQSRHPKQQLKGEE